MPADTRFVVVPISPNPSTFLTIRRITASSSVSGAVISAARMTGSGSALRLTFPFPVKGISSIAI